GGDRDGNPNVTAEVTREVLMLARWVAADLYLRDVEGLIGALSMQSATDELLQCSGASPEPYRVVLKKLRDRLRATLEWASKASEHDVPAPPRALHEIHELRQPLRLCFESLHACGMGVIADGALLDTLRRVATFGLFLL